MLPSTSPAGGGWDAGWIYKGSCAGDSHTGWGWVVELPAWTDTVSSGWDEGMGWREKWANGEGHLHQGVWSGF